MININDLNKEELIWVSSFLLACMVSENFTQEPPSERASEFILDQTQNIDFCNVDT